MARVCWLRPKSATKEGIHFAGVIPDTMRWTNHATFQQVVVFRSHR